MKIISISKSTKMIIRSSKVFNGKSILTGKYVDIEINNGTIRKVRPVNDNFPEQEPPEGVELINLDKYTILPGLIDCHVHLALNGGNFNSSLSLCAKKDQPWHRIQENLSRTLSQGIVAVRDGGDRQCLGLMAKNIVQQGIAPGPRICATGMALGKKGKYGHFLGPGLEGKQIHNAVKNIANMGVDQIKVLVSGLVSFKVYRQVGNIQFTMDELKALVSAARHQKLKVMAHASSDKAAIMAVQAGVDSIEHGYFISEATLEKMAYNGISWIPTLVPMANQTRGYLQNSHSHEELLVIKKTYKRQQRMIKTAVQIGVKVGIGTDAGAVGVVHGKSFLNEILFYEEAGLSKEEILRSATRIGSSILGLENEMGWLQPGIPPYLIAVRGNPLHDLAALEKIDFMILPSSG